ncbi:hypothetical protein E2C01_037037 [Portunus trituberculatus]|uniref:Uncharacterized protein n=1 Tax=Portunus trituberculatus TaxID=210409 RepID=A0A5B7F8A1_PORTR|nr:hypothetical protein [Portunus trituberculatus]
MTAGTLPLTFSTIFPTQQPIPAFPVTGHSSKDKHELTSATGQRRVVTTERTESGGGFYYIASAASSIGERKRDVIRRRGTIGCYHYVTAILHCDW